MKRVGVVGVWHETNTYARPIGLQSFTDYELLTGDAILAHHRGIKSVIGGFIDEAEFELVPVFSAGAWPAGPASEAAGTALLERLERALQVAAPLDGVLVNLHGAMVAVGHPDMERDVLGVVREVVGDEPTAAVLDLHANPSVDLAQRCNVLVSYDTYPHIDMYERGREVAALMADMLAGRRLRTVIGKTPVLSGPLAQVTDADPMRGLMLRARDAATKAGLVRISLTPGFAYSDVDRAGFSVLAVVDVDSQKSAASVVGEVLADVDRHASEFEVTRDDVRAGVERALAADHPPVILVDVGDNVGAGSAGDGTALLAELLRQGARDAIVTLADADVARAAAQLGCGSWIDTHVGGKTDRMHGVPVRIKGRVRRLSDGWYRTLGTWMTGQEFEMGITAVIEVEGNFLLVTERPTPPFHLEQLTHLGLDPSAARVVTAKGAIAWRAALGAVAQEVVEVATPGLCPIDVSSLQRQSKPVRVEP